MTKRFSTYTAYSTGSAAVWAVILLVTQTQSGSHTRHTVLLVGLGWLVGWTSATIARSVYPPPRKTWVSRAV